jgi:glycosyltransferase involved in cell wall biosynthesis
VLLEDLLRAWPRNSALEAWLDSRARNSLSLPPSARVRWVQPQLLSRLGAEFSLRGASRAADTVLCFHGLPPLLRLAARIEVFLQNRYHLGLPPLVDYPLHVGLRLKFKQAMSRSRRHAVHRYWVQTPSMARALQDWWGSAHPAPRIRVFPFTQASVDSHPVAPRGTHYDFIYVADGEAHKNHRRLIEAWVRLADQGIRPSLALTLSNRDQALQEWIAQQSQAYRLAVHQLGTLPHEETLALYSHARALIFPSLGESFGLPLVEARTHGCPIVASELDFVRDVCEPVETFDPLSSTSIARAVLRFLQRAERPIEPADSAAFLQALRTADSSA